MHRPTMIEKFVCWGGSRISQAKWLFLTTSPGNSCLSFCSRGRGNPNCTMPQPLSFPVQGPAPRTRSTWTSLYRDPSSKTCSNLFTVKHAGKQAVGILQECFVVYVYFSTAVVALNLGYFGLVFNLFLIFPLSFKNSCSSNL